MTQPPGGYPPPEPGDRHPPPADPFYAPPSWDPPTPSHSSYPPPPPPPPPSSPPPPPGSPYNPPPGSPYDPPTSPYLPPGATTPMAAPGSGPPTSPYGPPAYGPPGPPPRRRRGLVIGLIALAGALVLCAGGGIAAWLMTRDPDRNGAADPTVAVETFLQAVYHDQDASRAADLVCSEARDQASLQTKIDEIRAYQETLVSPTFEWSEPTVVEETDELAVVTVTVTMTTGDEKTADQNLRVSVLDKSDNGWWVCDLESAEAETATTPPPADEGTPEGPSPTEEGG